jgi:hypothetical protein
MRSLAKKTKVFSCLLVFAHLSELVKLGVPVPNSTETMERQKKKKKKKKRQKKTDSDGLSFVDCYSRARFTFQRLQKSSSLAV